MIHSGWPVDGASGDFIGWDDAGRVSIFRWRDGLRSGPATALNGRDATWVGVRLDDPKYPHWPLAFARGEGTEKFVTSHSSAVELRRCVEMMPDMMEVPGYAVFRKS